MFATDKIAFAVTWDWSLNPFNCEIGQSMNIGLWALHIPFINHYEQVYNQKAGFLTKMIKQIG